MLAAGTLLSGLPVMADELQQSVSVFLGTEYDSSPALMTSDEEGVWRAKIMPSYNLIGTYGADEYKARLTLNLERSSDATLSANREDPSLLLGWKRQTETGEFGLSAKYEEVSTRITELSESGLLSADGTRINKSLAGNWRTALSERSDLLADVEYKDVSYDGGAYIDYANLAGGVTYSYALSERAEPFVRGAVSHYEPDGSLGVSSDYYSIVAGLKWKATERLNWSVQAGANRVSGQTEDNGWQGNFALNYDITPRANMTMEMGRYVSPSGDGGFAESDQLKGTWGYAISERTRSGIEAYWRDYQGATPSTLYQLGAWVSHELSPFWNARLAYQYKQREQDGLPSASANQLGVSFVYTHPDF